MTTLGDITWNLVTEGQHRRQDHHEFYKNNRYGKDDNFSSI